MKQTILLCCITGMLSSCGNSDQSNVVSDAKKVQSEMKKMMPGSIPTTEGGWTMKAKNGKDWIAATMMPLDEETGRIIGDNNGEGFGFPYDRRQMEVGRKEIFGQGNAVDMSTLEGGEIKYWSGYKGEMEITKVEGDWAEGKFVITGTSVADSAKTVEVSDGFFRISIAGKK